MIRSMTASDPKPTIASVRRPILSTESTRKIKADAMLVKS